MIVMRFEGQIGSERAKVEENITDLFGMEQRNEKGKIDLIFINLSSNHKYPILIAIRTAVH